MYLWLAILLTITFRGLLDNGEDSCWLLYLAIMLTITYVYQ